MGCGSCGTKNGLPKGCNNNGACGVDGCGKLTVFDWLSNMQLPNGQKPFEFVEIRFKNDRKLYYKNENNLSLSIGDVVAVEGNPGHDIGVVTLTGELVRIQMKKKHLSTEAEGAKKIYRKANQKDLETWHLYRERETQTMIDSRIMAKNLGLEMKICDVEYQGDGGKVTFYYTAEGRVDFRQLIKEYASRFGVRIEMKQIGYRQEAAKIGGIGSCGRELCCSTWLTDFRSVSTAAARYQQLSINSQKLAGQCGKLKCCLNFELDTYLDALTDIPTLDTKLLTVNGLANCVKVDVFKREMWFSYDTGSVLWYRFPVEDVKEFIQMNKQNQKIDSLEELSKNVIETKPVFTDVIEEDSLERFDRKNKGQNKRNRQNRPRNNKESNQKQSSQSPRERKPQNRNSAPAKQQAGNNQPKSEGENKAPNKQRRRKPNPVKNKTEQGANPTEKQRVQPAKKNENQGQNPVQNGQQEQKPKSKKRYNRGPQNRKKD